MMKKIDGRKNNGGHSTKGKAGRKKGVGKYFILKKVVHDTFEEMYYKLMASDEVRKIILDEIRSKRVYKDSGKIYIIQNVANGLYKIGHTTTDIKRRLSHFNTHGEISLICMFEIDEYRQVEMNLHQTHKDKNVKGEWYRFTESEVLNVISHLTTIRFKDEL